MLHSPLAVSDAQARAVCGFLEIGSIPRPTRTAQPGEEKVA
jgi:hypothetical protein